MTLLQIRERQLAIATEMLHDARNPALDAKALRTRLLKYRSELIKTTSQIDDRLDGMDITLPMETLG